MRKPGSGSGGILQFNNPPEFAISEDDTVWIADNSSGRIQIHEGVNGRVCGSFKTNLQGITLKPRGITTLGNGTKVCMEATLSAYWYFVAFRAIGLRVRFRADQIKHSVANN